MALVREGGLFGLGNPLLDLVATVDPEFLQKYNLQSNGSTLATQDHLPMFAEIVDRYKVQYIAGGSMQNTLRVAQWILRKPNTTVFMGAIGRDEFGETVARVAVDDGVNARYQIIEDQPTGVCAILITGKDRSMCANIAAASHFTIDHLLKPENYALLSNAQVYHASGYFFTVCAESLRLVAELAANTNRPFALNLNAPYLMDRYADGFKSILPYCDILFGNEIEARALSKLQNFDTQDLAEIAAKTVNIAKVNKNLPQVVVFTQGSGPVVVGETNDRVSMTGCTVTSYPVPQLDDKVIVDTNGAGDAFVGGFLAQYVQGKSTQVSVECGIWAAAHVIQHSGCTFPKNINYFA